MLGIAALAVSGVACAEGRVVESDDRTKYATLAIHIAIPIRPIWS